MGLEIKEDELARAAMNAVVIVKKANELQRVGGYDTLDYPVACVLLKLLGRDPADIDNRTNESVKA